MLKKWKKTSQFKPGAVFLSFFSLDQLIKAAGIIFFPQRIVINRNWFLGQLSLPFPFVLLFFLLLLLFSWIMRKKIKLSANEKLFLAAALTSNLVDRWWRGGVIDFFWHPWLPAFNLADLGLTLLFIRFLVKYS